MFQNGAIAKGDLSLYQLNLLKKMLWTEENVLRLPKRHGQLILPRHYFKFREIKDQILMKTW